MERLDRSPIRRLLVTDSVETHGLGHERRQAVEATQDRRLEAVGWKRLTTAPLHRLTNWNPKFGSSGFSVGSRVEIEASTVEEDRGLEVLAVAEAIGHLLDPLNLRVQPLAGCVRHSVAEIREHAREGDSQHERPSGGGHPFLGPRQLDVTPILRR
jgi:hypothetical protein